MLPDPCPFTSSHASGCEVAFHRGFDLHFPNNRDAELLFTCLLATLAIFFKKVCIYLAALGRGCSTQALLPVACRILVIACGVF